MTARPARAAMILLVVLGSTLICGTSGAQEVEVVTISSVPPVPGVTVRLDDVEVVTDARGIATFPTDDLADLTDRIRVVTADLSVVESYRARFTRLYRLDNSSYAMAFDIDRPITLAFRGVNGEDIATSAIESTTLKNSLGGVRSDVPLDRPFWVFSERVVSTSRGPEVRDIEWSIDSVIVRQSNVVNRAQIRFLPREQPHVDIPVLFFSAHFVITDMFIGSPTGDAIKLTHPDGEVSVHPLDQNGELVLPSLPRGEYDVLVDGAGPSIARPLVLSRNQDVSLDFLSWLDIGLTGGVVLAFVIVPVIVGRFLMRGRLRHREEQFFSSLVLVESGEELDHDLIGTEGEIILVLELALPGGEV